MANYYCLMAGLPDVKLTDGKPRHSLLQMKEELEGILEPQDERLLQTYFLRFDCENLVDMLEASRRRSPYDIIVDPSKVLPLTEDEDRWNMAALYDRPTMKQFVEEARATDGAVKGFPAFMADFVRAYDVHQNDYKWFARDVMMVAYYDYARQCPNTMMADWYELNFNILNILTALIARRQGWVLADYVQGSGPVVNALLKQSVQADFGLGAELDYVQPLMRAAETTDPVDKERQIDALRWAWLDERTFFEPFDITALFAYLVRTEILERWALLDPEQGRQRFTRIIEDLRGSVKVPEEFIRR